MNFEKLVEMLEALGYTYVDEYDSGDWMYFQSQSKCLAINETATEFKVGNTLDEIL